MSAAARRAIGAKDANSLGAVPPRSAKYADIGPTLDTGHNMRRYVEKHGEVVC